MGLKAKTERFIDQIELFIKLDGVDELGYAATDLESIGLYYAKVERMSGSRLLRYHELGYSNPITIKMYNPMDDIVQVEWDGSIAAVRSMTTDKNNTDCVVIYADVVSTKPK